ncbi:MULTISPECIES: PAS domain S-box protein [Sphingobium]|nr:MULTISPECIES: PAS domain S-box protein [Sphingobium]QDC39020.1 PAS domain S-box protein [Sphingobium fuliginis ATCC 27551]QNG43999.1 PAS domain S-box protein [Sphingobium yanoikuyae]
MSGSPTATTLRASLAESEAREANSRREAFEASAWLAAIVDNSDDAILSKSLDGIVMSWNAGAERLFGYTAAEAVGKPITIIIPEDRLHEEDTILAKLRRGERVADFETVRRRKDGSFIDIALTVSPVKDAAGNVLGASKIARDITPNRRAAEHQDLILREMNHRIKNLFALTTALVSISARETDDVDELAEDLTARFGALANAHALTLPDLAADTIENAKTTLATLLKVIVAAHEGREASRITIDGDDTAIGARALPTIALLLHELATNAAKYGALASADGRLAITIAVTGERMAMTWRETGAPDRAESTASEGFGSRLEKASVSTLHGSIERTWLNRGLEIRLQFPVADLNR